MNINRNVDGGYLLLDVINQEIEASVTNWAVYMILCSDNSLYTGITNNLVRRFGQHCGAKGAKYFRGRQALKVVYVEDGHNRSTASKREIAIKKLKPAEKLALIASEINNVNKYAL